MSNPIADSADPGQGVPDVTAPAGIAPAGEPDPSAETFADLQKEGDTERTDETEPYDAVVLISFGGPDAPEEVEPFLRRVTRGEQIPEAQLAEMAEHYLAFGGHSPVNDQNRALLAALAEEFGRRNISTPLLWGNLNSEPLLTDTLRTAAGEGMTRFLAVTTSAYSSYTSCRHYREDIAASMAQLADEGTEVRVDKVRQYWNHPGFAATNSRVVSEAARQVRDRTGSPPYLLFVTHTIPEAMDDTSGPGDEDGNVYSAQHETLARAITEETRATLGEDVVGELAYCSRSGPLSQDWLTPDVNERLRALADDGVTHVVLAPIGFVSDQIDVTFDLDIKAQETAQKVGIEVLRVPTVGTDPQFVSGLVDLVLERAAEARSEAPDRPGWPLAQAWPSVCQPGCCPNLRSATPAACGTD